MKGLVFSLALLIASAIPCQTAASPVTLRWSGHVTQVNQDGRHFLDLGEAWTGIFIYDPDVPPSQVYPEFSVYNAIVFLSLESENDHFQLINRRSSRGAPVLAEPGGAGWYTLLCCTVAEGMIDDFEIWITTSEPNAGPTGLPTVEQLTTLADGRIRFSGYESLGHESRWNLGFRATIDAMTVIGATPVPEPSALALTLSGVLVALAAGYLRTRPSRPRRGSLSARGWPGRQ